MARSERQKLRKKKNREKIARERVLNRRKHIREEAKLEKERERLEWKHRDRIEPIRKNKEKEV
jgi:hypothetical protein